MARKALLIGSRTGELGGVGNDVTAMEAALGLWGFATVRCESENASRAGILDAYERLIAGADADDAIVLYYSGHGGYALRPDDRPAERDIQFLVPTDYELSSDGDFRAVIDAELSVLLARLTLRTRNVVVVLDCCHAGHMSRDPGVLVRSTSRPVAHEVVREHVEMLARTGLRLDLWQAPSNPDAVRIVACAPEQVAYEADNTDGVRMGVLTDALTRTLAELHRSGLELSWATVIDRVRQLVVDAQPGQRPDAEGPARRLVFATVESDAAGTLPVFPDEGDRVRIGGARLFGVRVDDELLVVPLDSVGPADTAALGTVLVDKVGTESAWGRWTSRSGTTALPLGARACLTRTALPPLPVHIDVNDGRFTGIVRALNDIPQLTIVDGAPVKVVADAEGGVTIEDDIGPMGRPRPAATEGPSIVADLRRMAQAHQLRRFSELPGLGLTTPVTIDFARVVDGQRQPLPRSGAVLYPGDKICVDVGNAGPDGVYVSLLDIGVSARTTVLDPSSPSGVLIEAGANHVFGFDKYTGTLLGMEVGWPAAVVGERPRTETIVVLLSEEPVDVTVLEQDGVRSTRGLMSPLERRLVDLAAAGRRETVPLAITRPSRFSVQQLEFELVPTAPPPASTARFHVDDRPAASVILLRPRSSEPAKVQVRLCDLALRHDRRGGGFRLDTIAVTGGEVGRARTERLSSPGTDLVVFAGEVRDRLDIAVWLSRDGGEPPLADLLAGHTDAAPIDRAGRELARVCQDTVGLFRSVLLDSEDFGIGRSTAVKAAGVAFRLLIDEG
ncbi:caspase family protein [Kutzneria sp. NPDC051319]|uniref:caspase family protein n=1 Tax=Kutzneria sp. NPDC051319 TaxID=3155047 RepID=UPI00342F7121